MNTIIFKNINCPTCRNQEIVHWQDYWLCDSCGSAWQTSIARTECSDIFIEGEIGHEHREIEVKVTIQIDDADYGAVMDDIAKSAPFFQNSPELKQFIRKNIHIEDCLWCAGQAEDCDCLEEKTEKIPPFNFEDDDDIPY